MQHVAPVFQQEEKCAAVLCPDNAPLQGSVCSSLSPFTQAAEIIRPSVGNGTLEPSP